MSDPTAFDAAPRWRGINHLAMVTPDMDTTVRFYHGVLGMRVVAAIKAGPMRHYFFEIAPGNTCRPLAPRVEIAELDSHSSKSVDDFVPAM